MNDNRTLNKRRGDAGENAAVRWLVKIGYEILECNFSCRIGEIDIVALDREEGVIAFAEVKTRSSISYGLPCQAVNSSKQRKILLSSQLWLKINSSYRVFQPRLDIIEVIRSEGSFYVRHIKNAFQEGR